MSNNMPNTFTLTNRGKRAGSGYAPVIEDSRTNKVYAYDAIQDFPTVEPCCFVLAWAIPVAHSDNNRELQPPAKL